MKKMLIAIVIVIITSSFSVNAASYFKNSNGVEMNKKQYDYIGKLYVDGYQLHITKDEFDVLKNYDLFNQPISSIYNNSQKLLKASSVSNSGRTLKISKSCSSKCVVTLSVDWTIIPTIQSYDVIGMRFKNASANIIGGCALTSNGYNVNYNTSSSNFKSNKSGFGYSVKLGNFAETRIITSATVDLNGTVYGAYEHAMSDISIAKSKNYSFSNSGQGSVFLFTGNTSKKYDNVAGVQINT